MGRSAATFPEREAVIYGTRRSTYAQFESEVQQLARALSKSIKPGQVVSFVAPNTPEMLAAHYAVPLIGAVLNPLNPRLAGREFSYIFEHAKKFVHHAVRNDPYTFSRYAKACSEAVTNALVGPKKPLTDEQMKHEKGLFYGGQVGDSLHKVTAIVDDEELLQLNAMREFATKLDSVTSTMRAQVHEEAKGTTHPADGHEKSTEEVAGGSRITPEDIDYGIGQLFDGQTKAERWLHTLMDFLSSGLILHKTYDPHATDEEQRRRDQHSPTTWIRPDSTVVGDEARTMTPGEDSQAQYSLSLIHI